MTSLLITASWYRELQTVLHITNAKKILKTHPMLSDFKILFKGLHLFYFYIYFLPLSVDFHIVGQSDNKSARCAHPEIHAS